MKKWMMKWILTMVLGLAGLALLPAPVAASVQASPELRLVTPSPTPIKPAVPDFSDAEFVQADQPETGEAAGGEVIVIVGGVFLLLVLIVILLILGILT